MAQETPINPATNVPSQTTPGNVSHHISPTVVPNSQNSNATVPPFQIPVQPNAQQSAPQPSGQIAQPVAQPLR
jgi:hypothetical protein